MNGQVDLWGLSPSLKRRLDLEISTLQNAPSEADKLTRLLQFKNRQKDEAIHIGDTEGLVTERD